MLAIFLKRGKNVTALPSFSENQQVGGEERAKLSTQCGSRRGMKMYSACDPSHDPYMKREVPKVMGEQQQFWKGRHREKRMEIQMNLSL